MLRTLLFGAVMAVLLSGCATMGGSGQKDMEIQKMRNQISVMNSQLQAKDEEIAGLRSDAGRAQEEMVTSSNDSAASGEDREVKSRPTIKQIQKALKNSGHYSGSVDGHYGKQTKEAVKDFQKANNLKPDGKVGKKTWRALRKQL
jgi:peptidoglycan hydrolase-like protein with peptidoglycan-binding domain/predicted small secreted protein